MARLAQRTHTSAPSETANRNFGSSAGGSKNLNLRGRKFPSLLSLDRSPPQQNKIKGHIPVILTQRYRCSLLNYCQAQTFIKRTTMVCFSFFE